MRALPHWPQSEPVASSRQFNHKGATYEKHAILAVRRAPVVAILRLWRAGARAEDTIKIGILHSLSGTMAISETILKNVMLMQVADLNAKGGLLGKQIEPIVVDPASNWPLFAEKARELISQGQGRGGVRLLDLGVAQIRAAGVRGAERPAVLSAGIRRRRSRHNIFYGSSVPDNKAIPAVKYLMSKDGGDVKRFVLEGTDYVYPRTSNKIIRAFLKAKGVADEDIMENYTPFGFSDWQTEVAAIKKFGSAGKKTAVVSTVNGDANVPFYKELGNQGVKATDIPVIAFSVGEEELAGVDTKPLVGHLAAWSYFESVNTPENKAFIAKWRDYIKNPKRVTNDPMELAYILFHMWVAGGAAGRHHRCRCGSPGDDRPEGQVAVGLRGGDGQQPPHGQAGDDRRDPGRRSVQHRLQEQGAAAEGLEPLCRGQQGQGRRLVVAVGLRRLHLATLRSELISLAARRAKWLPR